MARGWDFPRRGCEQALEQTEQRTQESPDPE